MPIITSNLYFLKIIKLVSVGTGPDTLICDFVKLFIALYIIFFSSDFFDGEKLCGFKPRIAKFGFLLKTFL